MPRDLCEVNQTVGFCHVNAAGQTCSVECREIVSLGRLTYLCSCACESHRQTQHRRHPARCPEARGRHTYSDPCQGTCAWIHGVGCVLVFFHDKDGQRLVNSYVVYDAMLSLTCDARLESNNTKVEGGRK